MIAGFDANLIKQSCRFIGEFAGLLLQTSLLHGTVTEKVFVVVYHRDLPWMPAECSTQKECLGYCVMLGRFRIILALIRSYDNVQEPDDLFWLSEFRPILEGNLFDLFLRELFWRHTRRVARLAEEAVEPSRSHHPQQE